MEVLNKILPFAIALIMLLSGNTKNNGTETDRSLATGGEAVTGRAKVDPADITYASSYSFKKLTYNGIERMDFRKVIEAETARKNSGITLRKDKKGYSGKGYIDISDNTAFELSVDIPASQYYKITVCHCAGSHKENPLFFNGLKVMDIVSENGKWVETTVDGVFLEKGRNKVTLGAGWSWFSMDSIRIENGEPISDSIYEGIDDTLCNP